MTSEILVPSMASGQANYQLAVYRPAGYRLVSTNPTAITTTTNMTTTVEFLLAYSSDIRETSAMTDHWDTGIPKTNNVKIEVEFKIDGVPRRPRDKYTMVGGGGGGPKDAKWKKAKYRGSVRGQRKNVFLSTARPGKRK